MSGSGSVHSISQHSDPTPIGGGARRCCSKGDWRGGLFLALPVAAEDTLLVGAGEVPQEVAAAGRALVDHPR